MSAALVLILLVTAAYLAAHVAFDWLARRFTIVSGAEYLLLGILLGPEVSGLISTGVASGFAPFMTLAIGWMGAVVGAQLHLPQLVRTPGVYYRVALTESLLSLAVASGVLGLALAWLFDLPPRQVIVPAVALGSIATTSSPSGIHLIARRLVRRGPVVRQLEVTAVADACVAIVAFGLLLCVAHVPPTLAQRPPTATEWAAITLAIGVVGGALFHLFLGGERHIDRLFVALLGALTLASGAAAYLRLSPLLPTLLVAAILVNTSRNREEIRQVLHRIERPLYFVLLVFAGAVWRPNTEAGWLLPVLLYLALRAAVKIGGGRLAARLNDMLPVLGPGWGRALVSQGPLGVAIGLNYLILDGSLLPNVVFTATVASVLLTDLLSARLVRSVLREYLRRRSLDGPRAPDPLVGSP